VILSSETPEKQKKHKMTSKDYQRLPEILKKGKVIQQTELKWVFFWREYKAVLKLTQSRDEAYLVSFHRTRNREIKRIEKQGKIFREEIP